MELNSKQRSNLKALASNLSPVLTVGKGGNTENVYKEADNLLEARELIKISVLNNSTADSNEFAQEFARKLKAIPVIAIGNKFVLYRRSKKENIKHIEF